MIIHFRPGAQRQQPRVVSPAVWVWMIGSLRLGPFRVVAAQQFTAGSVETETYAPGAVAGQTRQSGGAATTETYAPGAVAGQTRQSGGAATEVSP